MLYIKKNSKTSKKLYISSSPFNKKDKVNDKTFPMKYVLKFKERECYELFKQKIAEYNITLSSNEAEEQDWNDRLREFDWYDMPEYYYPNDYEKIVDIHYRKEDKTLIDETILPVDKEFKIKTPNIKIKGGEFNGDTKYTISYDVPSVPEERKKLLASDYVCDLSISAKYPIYVISLSRYDYERSLTINWLEKGKVKYYLVVEPFEKEKYAERLREIKKENGNVYGELLVGERDYHKEGKGSVPVRNFVYHHSKYIIKSSKHWILDDNIKEYERRNYTIKKTIYGGVTFRVIEDYVDRYVNVRIAGHDYSSFNPPTKNCLPVSYTKVFSSILISNEFEEDEIWKGKYNEDLDLSIREWIENRPVMLFRNITCNKIKTGKIKGGNQVDIYKNESDNKEDDWSYKKAMEIIQRYKDKYDGLYVSLKEDYIGRKYHHSVKYERFRIPILKEEYKYMKNKVSVNNYNIKLVKR